jgi:methylated-DNA-[protein]-cysteine S-methyltransferase
MNEIYTVVPSPVGELLLSGLDTRLRRLAFIGSGTKRPPVPIDPAWRRDDDAFPQARTQLDEYFAGARRDFELELELIGTEWELQVWGALQRIPYAQTRSYGQIAAALSTPAAARAVGLANARNPVALIVPCHRVIGASGTLTGYGGGLERKRTLLDLEAGRLALV